jgi:riboflavin transporter FmnP
MNQNQKVNARLKNLIMIAIFSAIAFLIMVLFKIAIVPAAPYLKYDPKDVVIAMGGFIFGPLAAFCMSVVVSFLEMVTVSESGPIGLIMNSISSCALTCTAAVIYKKKRTIAGAVTGLISGVIITTGVMLLWNYVITPIYMSVPREIVAKLLIPVFLPFNLIKGSLNAGITMLVYKHLSKALKKLNLIPQSTSDITTTGIRASRKINISVLLASCFVIITCVMIILVLNNII